MYTLVNITIKENDPVILYSEVLEWHWQSEIEIRTLYNTGHIVKG